MIQVSGCNKGLLVWMGSLTLMASYDTDER